MLSPLLTDLNPSQRTAVEYPGGPLLVLAGAGSGKTRVLTYRIAYLLQKGMAAPQQILAVTFTNKAANEMKQRIEDLIQSQVQGMWIGTFHSMCARILRREARHLGYSASFTIYDVEDQLQQIQRIMDFLNINREILTPRQVQYAISQNKNKMRTPQEIEAEAQDFAQQQIARIFWEYEVALRRNNAFDFDDLLIKPLELFTQYEELLAKYQNKFKYILVDEYQDTNKAQYLLVKLLSGKHRNLFVVGDEDQSIYRWRGAEIENILNFEKDFPDCKIIRLEQNYRSTQTILNAANVVVANNRERLGKNLWCEKDRGEKIQVIGTQNEVHEAARVTQIVQRELTQYRRSLNEIAVLYRTNAQSRALEDHLRRANIPYQIVGGIKFYERKEVKDVLAYLRLIINPDDSVSLRRIINVPSRGIGKMTLQRLEDYANQKKMSLFRVLLEVDSIPDIHTRIKQRIQTFRDKLESFQKKKKQLSAFDITRQIIEEFGLRSQYSQSPLPEDMARVENINELLNSIAIFSENRPAGENHLEQFLEEVSLLTDIDRWDADNPTITLMTLHSAKGLEFHTIIITGLEEGLFPIFRSMESNKALEEERRLFYVGMTRAKERLYLLWALQRHRFRDQDYGTSFTNTPSRFLDEIPKEFKRDIRPPSRVYARQKEFLNPDKTTLPLENDFFTSRVEGADGFEIGQWIVHNDFGKGQILAIERTHLGTKLTVAFVDRNIRKIIAEYANLQFNEE